MNKPVTPLYVPPNKAKNVKLDDSLPRIHVPDLFDPLLDHLADHTSKYGVQFEQVFDCDGGSQRGFSSAPQSYLRYLGERTLILQPPWRAISVLVMEQCCSFCEPYFRMGSGYRPF